METLIPLLVQVPEHSWYLVIVAWVIVEIVKDRNDDDDNESVDKKVVG